MSNYACNSNARCAVIVQEKSDNLNRKQKEGKTESTEVNIHALRATFQPATRP